MDKAILVDMNIKEGKKLILELDKASFPVSSALWFYYPDSNNWKLIIASTKIDEKGPIKVYDQILKIMNKKKIKDIQLADIYAIGPSNSLIVLLKSVLRTSPKAISDIRFTANTIKNNYIEDSYIYRLS